MAKHYSIPDSFGAFPGLHQLPFGPSQDELWRTFVPVPTLELYGRDDKCPVCNRPTSEPLLKVRPLLWTPDDVIFPSNLPDDTFMRSQVWLRWVPAF